MNSIPNLLPKFALIVSLTASLVSAAIASDLETLPECVPNAFQTLVMSCSKVASKDVHYFRTIGWVEENQLKSARVCVYKTKELPDFSQTGVINAEVQIHTIFENEEFGSRLYEETYSLLKNDALDDLNKSAVALVGRQYEIRNDKLEVNIDRVENSLQFDYTISPYLLGLKSKAHMIIQFSNCESFQ
jgi:hypothetical protein